MAMPEFARFADEYVFVYLCHLDLCLLICASCVCRWDEKDPEETNIFRVVSCNPGFR